MCTQWMRDIENCHHRMQFRLTVIQTNDVLDFNGYWRYCLVKKNILPFKKSSSAILGVYIYLHNWNHKIKAVNWDPRQTWNSCAHLCNESLIKPLYIYKYINTHTSRKVHCFVCIVALIAFTCVNRKFRIYIYEYIRFVTEIIL